MERLIVDTGFLVALGRERDPCHDAARRFLGNCRLPLVTVSAVVAETCYFLTPRAKQAFLRWVGSGGPTVFDVPLIGYAELAATIGKYADLDLDFADAALVWLANEASARKIVTVDATDFSVIRLKGGKRFELVEWK